MLQRNFGKCTKQGKHLLKLFQKRLEADLDEEIQLLVGKVIEENPQSVIDYKMGRSRIRILVGQAMKASRKANPKLSAS